MKELLEDKDRLLAQIHQKETGKDDLFSDLKKARA